MRADSLRRLVVLGLIPVGLGVAGCDVSVSDTGDVSVNLVSGIAQDEDVRSYTLSPDGELAIENGTGSIEVQAWESPTLEVTITREVRARTDEAAEALLEQVDIAEEAGPDRVSLVTSAPQNGSIRVRYAVRTPASIATTMKNQNGRITVSGMAGAVRATQGNGQVDATGILGPIQASVINGAVGVELAAVGGDIGLATVNGPVRITIPVDARGDLSATVVNGRISTSGLTLEDLQEPSRRELSGRLNGGGPRITLETTNGPIVVTGR